MNKTALTVENLTKVYSTNDKKKSAKALNNISFKVNQGEVFGLLGPNGAGKTTSFNLVIGLLRPDRGQVLLDGHPVADLSMPQGARLGIGYLPQEPSVFRQLTVQENLELVLVQNKLI